MKITVNLKENSYPVYVQKGLLENVENYIRLDRKVLVVTDSGVPEQYADSVLKKCKEGIKYVFKAGERSKNFKVYQDILKTLVENNFTRSDCVVAVGGGVAGDMAGFAASTYMRGIDFFNCPTTLLSQVDSSVGGKTAIDFLGVKNVVGSFFQPKAVVADISTLSTLPEKQISNGLAEAVKMAACFDKDLFFKIKNSRRIEDILTEVVTSSVRIKKSVVEKDEKESGLRRALNFGHTVGHAVESYFKGKMLHGQAVAVGMVSVSSGAVKDELVSVLKKYRLPVSAECDKQALLNTLIHDKKISDGTLNLVVVKDIGSFEFEKVKLSELEKLL